MSKAIDPFEEFLRKKKVKQLEEKFRRERAAEEDAAEGDGEEDARLREEMDDFFESGQTAGAELFSKAKGMSDDKVDEIKDALEDVFEKEAATPRTEEVPADGPFVHFFKEVQDEFGDEEPALPAAPEPVEPAAPAPPVAEKPTPKKKPAAAKPAAPKKKPAPAPKPAPAKKPAPQAAEAASREAIAVEISSHEPAEEPGAEPSGRLNLAEMLLAGTDEADELQRRVEVLCRLVAKLVERTELPESEIIESLIKSGVEF